MNKNLTAYYNDRAKEYDKVYQIPEEQEDLAKAAEIFQRIFKGKSVVEIACGTGYWTEQISKTSSSILATDINNAVIEIAKTRHFSCEVTFQVADMNCLTTDKYFEGLFGGFIWSHIPLQDLDHFLQKIKKLITGKGEIVLIDSRQIDGTSHDKKRITSIDPFGNTFQTRKLEDGTTHEVLKNFPGHDFLVDKLSQIATDIRIIDLDYYWIATCKTKG